MVTNWNGFDYVRTGNSKLLVTIGESWTWGDSLRSSWKDRTEDKEYRLANVFGGQLANMLAADFLNIAEPGQSNLWITDHFKLFSDNVEQFNYDEIIVVLTLTEVGREFQGDRDTLRNYCSDLENITHVDEFINQLSKYISDNIQTIKTDSYKLVIGTNFVDSNYDLPVLNKTWVDIIADELSISIKRPCFVVGSWVFDRFTQLLEYAKLYHKEQYLSDILRAMNAAAERTDFLLSSPYNFKVASKHPTPEGHKLWAEYIFKTLND